MFGICGYQQGRHAEAYELISQALKIQLESPAAHTNLGLTLQALGREDDALASYKKALAIKPDNPDVLANRGSALLALDRLDDALASCDRALAIDPNHVEALFNHANAVLAQNRLDEALASPDREFLDRHQDLVHFGAEIKDFADTAALASLMDLVRSILQLPTSPADWASRFPATGR